MQTTTTRRALGCALALALLTTGCGIFKSSTSQASSESSSKSSSSPFRSSSASSGDDSSELASDVRDYSAVYAASGGDEHGFERTIGRIAAGYGVFDWESDPVVHHAMGSGFRRAGLDATQALRLGSALSGPDQERLAWVLAGYEDASRP